MKILFIIFLFCETLVCTPQVRAIPNPVITVKHYPPPPDHAPAPPYPLKLGDGAHCAINAVIKNSNLVDPPPASQALNVHGLHRIHDGRGRPLTGRGVMVGIIDSGVTPNRRLPHLRGGGDYVVPRDNGLFDCDHHGTIIAGIIGAAPSRRDGFIGVAPDSHIISVRALSNYYQAVNFQDASVDFRNPNKVGANNLKALADAIVHIANLGASVINVSVTTCYAVKNPIAWSRLAGAVHYATHKRNAVIVTSAGNSGDAGCGSNPLRNEDDPSDTRGWGSVVNVSLPSLFAGHGELLSVGGSTVTGETYFGTMTGPWVSVMAPAMNIVSLDPAINASRHGKLTNGDYITEGEHRGDVVPIKGTSFAAAYVTGVVALVRQLHPDMRATQVIRFVESTAHHVSQQQMGYAGYGLIDPYRLLTVDPKSIENTSPAYSAAAEPMKPKPPVDNTARNLARIIVISILAAGVLTYYIGFTVTSSRHHGEN